ncbi:hypothetical protein Mapa_014609 [Marchantia paleacea]|nr:hypothetical protein Mapa_014609 [Marchantia paleacea]
MSIPIILVPNQLTTYGNPALSSELQTFLILSASWLHQKIVARLSIPRQIFQPYKSRDEVSLSWYWASIMHCNIFIQYKICTVSQILLIHLVETTTPNLLVVSVCRQVMQCSLHLGHSVCFFTIAWYSLA